MAGRGIVSFTVAFVVVAPLAAQAPSGLELIVTEVQPARPYQSVVYRIDPVQGTFRTLQVDQSVGGFHAITMDRDNQGFVAAYEGRGEGGLCYLARSGSGGLTVTGTDFELEPPARLRAAALTAEDTWIVGTERTRFQNGLLRRLDAGSFVDVASLPGADVVQVIVERARGSYILALNVFGNGMLVSYDPSGARSHTTLVKDLAPITDVVQDPDTGGFLVTTSDPKAGLVHVDVSTLSSVTTKSLPLPKNEVGLALAIDPFQIGGATRDLWVLVPKGLYRLAWDRRSRTYSETRYFQLPALTNPTAMILAGERNYLITATIQTGGANGDLLVTLRSRLGKRYAGLRYYLGASLGTTPGINLAEGRTVNLAFDLLLWVSLTNQWREVFAEFSGETGNEGELTGRTIVKKDVRRVLSGLPVYFAGVIVEPAPPGTVHTVTNTVGLTLF